MPEFQLIPTVLIVITLFILVGLSIALYGFKKLHMLFRRKCNVLKTQLSRGTATLIRRILSVCAVTVVFYLIAKVLFSLGITQQFSVTYSSVNTDSPIPVTTTSSTIYATLMTVILALIALAVTAFVFLNDALSNRASYELQIINSLKSDTRRRLFINCLISGICIIALLIIDNINTNGGKFFSIIQYVVVCASFFDIVCLCIYINSIVNYEKQLLNFARSYIEYNQNSFKIEKGGILPKDADDNKDKERQFTEVVKSIGDLDRIVNCILQNHEPELRMEKSQVNVATLQTILKGKEAEKNDSINNIIHNVCIKYKRLIEIRNCMWILYDYGEDINLDGSILKETTQKVLSELFTLSLNSEHFDDTCFNNNSFKKAVFTESTFRGSALNKVSFQEAKLDNCDFSGSLLHNVDFSEANCKYAVFSNSKIINPLITKASLFENAVFRDVEFQLKMERTQDAKKQDAKKYNFMGIAAHGANFTNDILCEFDFENGVFAGATFANAELINCKFTGTCLANAVVSSAKFIGSCDFNNADCSNLVAAGSSWGEDTKNSKIEKDPNKYYITLTGSRFLRANFAYSQLYRCNFAGAYLNDASFMSSAIKNCCFLGAFVNYVDFTNTAIEHTNFSNAQLVDALFITRTGQTEDGTPKQFAIKDAIFDKSNMKHCSISGYTFEGCNFNETILDDVMIRDTNFIKCTFNNTRFVGATFFNVTWDECELDTSKSSSQGICFGTANDQLVWKLLLREGKKRKRDKHERDKNKHSI